jgi:hypothetical protein
LIAINNILVSDEVLEAQFVCDLTHCKGGCCEDGDAGAPLEKAEMKILSEIYDQVKPYLTQEGINEIESNGFYHYDKEFGWVTPTIAGKMCAYGIRDKNGIIKCGIEQAYSEGKVNWRKPISCHLFPIKTRKTIEYEMVNYQPRQDLCSKACSLGKKLKIPVYRFLKDALIRKYGEDFYNELEKVAASWNLEKKNTVVFND